MVNILYFVNKKKDRLYTKTTTSVTYVKIILKYFKNNLHDASNSIHCYTKNEQSTIKIFNGKQYFLIEKIVK